MLRDLEGGEDQMSVIVPYEPSAVDLNASTLSVQGREQVDTDSYKQPESLPATDVGCFDPHYVTNDYLRDQGFAEPVPPTSPLQYKPYRTLQPLSQDRYFPYRLPEQKGEGYRAYRRN